MMEYRVEDNLKVEEFREVLVNSTLENRRPIYDHNTLKKMVEMGNILITVRHNGILMGVSKLLTNFSFCIYLSDLAVDVSYQKRIGGRIGQKDKIEGIRSKINFTSRPCSHFVLSDERQIKYRVLMEYFSEPNSDI